MANGTQQQFTAFAMRMFTTTILPLLTQKGKQYSQVEGAALTNFFDSSMLFEISPRLDLMVLANKHWHAMCKWAGGRRDMPDAEVSGRAIDIVVYMLLLIYMLEPASPEDKPFDPAELDVHISELSILGAKPMPKYLEDARSIFLTNAPPSDHLQSPQPNTSVPRTNE